MEPIRGERLRELARWQSDEPLVSIYLPTHRAGKEIRQDPIRLKNLLAEAAEALGWRGTRARAVTQRLAAAEALLKDTDFWNHQLDALAVFVAPEMTETYRLPQPRAELCLVADHFHLKPLLPLAQGEDRFHLLALSQGRVRLFAADRTSMEELPLGPIPASLAEALGGEVSQQSLQFHTRPAAPSGGGRGEATFHGQGGGEDDRDVELRRFLEVVDRGLQERVGDGERPLLLAAVTEVAATFRKLTRHPNVLPETVEGNHDRAEPRALHARAWAVAEPLLAGQRERDAARIREQVGTGSASSDLKEIAAAARAGRIEALFVALDRQVWGRLDGRGQPEIHEQRQPGDGDLLDRVACLGLLGGARVHVRPMEDLPSDRPAAALFRF